MLKKILLTLVCLPFAFACFSAQPTATLQSGDNVTPFYGENAFVEAYEVATDGDIITLSPGVFKSTDIQKSVTVIGTYAFSDKSSEATKLDVTRLAGDNIWIEGIRFENNLWIQSSDHATISRCYITEFYDQKDDGGENHKNTVLLDCLVNQCNAMEYSQNMVLKNCCINRFYDINDKDNMALIENCNIPLWLYDYNGDYKQPYAIYRNCFLGCFTAYWTANSILSAPSEFYSNLFFKNHSSNDYKSWTIDMDACLNSENVYNGISVSNHNGVIRYNSVDSYKQEGVVYGVINHKEYPAIPVVTSSEISTETDAEGNLHVKINASARD